MKLFAQDGASGLALIRTTPYSRPTPGGPILTNERAVRDPPRPRSSTRPHLWPQGQITLLGGQIYLEFWSFYRLLLIYHLLKFEANQSTGRCLHEG